MKNTMAGQNGMTLIELILGLMLTGLLVAGIFGLLSTSLASWKAGSSRSELQQTARFAVDSMVRDLRYGDNFVLESDKSITYRNIKAGPQYGNTYRYHVDTTKHNLYKTGINPFSAQQPVTGDNVAGFNKIVINQGNEAMFTRPDASSNMITIILIVKDTYTGHSWTLQSAVASVTQTFK